MIIFHELHIENYLSVAELDLRFPKGVISLTGANGSGKTTILTALQMCLFNKSMRNPKGNIEDSYNKHTGLPYKISCVFSKKDTQYTVINDRSLNQITILENGKNISPKGIKGQLAKIEQILEVDFFTFSALTFLSQTTLTSIFDLTSSENLLYKFLDIELLNHLEKGLKAKQAELKKYSSALLAGISALEKQEETLKNFTSINIELLRMKQASLQEALLLLNDGEAATRVNMLKEKEEVTKNIYQKHRETYVALKTELGILEEQLQGIEAGVCPTCGQSVEAVSNSLKERIANIKQGMKEAATKGKKLEEELTRISATISSITQELYQKKNEILSELNEVKGRILVAEEQQKNYERLQTSLESIAQQKAEILKEYQDIVDAINFCASALGVIKSGAVTKEYVLNFTKLLNNKIDALTEATNLKIDIRATNVKGVIAFDFIHKGVYKNYQDLSSGEKTKCSLVCTFAVLDTLEFLTGVSFNILALDELLSVVDKEGLSLFKILLNKYRESKTVFLVSHHNEIENTFFDSCWYAKIINNITTVEFK